MNDFTNRIAGLATLALAILPAAALATGAHAATAVRIGDLNLASASGKATFEQRAAHAAARFCADERSLSVNLACRTAVRTELHEKLATVQKNTAQVAERN